MTRPVGAFMRERSVIAFGIAERFETGHLHEIGADIVIRNPAAMTDIGACGGKEFFRPCNPLHRVKPRFRRGMKLRGQSFDLLDIEHGVGFQERDRFCRLCSALHRGRCG
jgi:hypothetical protein